MLKKMGIQSRVELLTLWMSKYAKTRSKKRKGEIIDFLVESTGYKNRKTVIRLLRHGWKGAQSKRRGRPRILGQRDRSLLGKIWLVMGRPCGKRMVAQLPERLPRLEEQMGITSKEREKLLSISAATIDRELRGEKRRADQSQIN